MHSIDSDLRPTWVLMKPQRLDTTDPNRNLAVVDIRSAISPPIALISPLNTSSGSQSGLHWPAPRRRPASRTAPLPAPRQRLRPLCGSHTTGGMQGPRGEAESLRACYPAILNILLSIRSHGWPAVRRTAVWYPGQGRVGRARRQGPSRPLCMRHARRRGALRVALHGRGASRPSQHAQQMGCAAACSSGARLAKCPRGSHCAWQTSRHAWCWTPEHGYLGQLLGPCRLSCHLHGRDCSGSLAVAHLICKLALPRQVGLLLPVAVQVLTSSGCSRQRGATGLGYSCAGARPCMLCILLGRMGTGGAVLPEWGGLTTESSGVWQRISLGAPPPGRRV